MHVDVDFDVDDRFSPVRRLLADAAGPVFPGAVLLVARGEETLLLEAVGRTALPGTGLPALPAAPDTVYDLASLTKPLATTAVLMTLVADGRVRLDDPVGRWVPEVRGTGKEGLTLASLLAHSSGLPMWCPFAADIVTERGQVAAGTRDARAYVARRIGEEPLEYPAGQGCAYSDLGFILLGWVVEAATGSGLDAAFRDRVARPLGLARTFFVRVGVGVASPPPVPRDEVAPTEFCPTRRRVLRGEVHDDNAWALGGVAGHAGLFGTATEVAAIVRAMLAAHLGGADGPFSPEVVRRFLALESSPPGTTRTLGFDTPSAQGSSAGTRPPPGLVGHLGFTGTSFWADPATGPHVVLLTNRVHPTRANEAIKDFRPALHDAVWAALAD